MDGIIMKIHAGLLTILLTVSGAALAVSETQTDWSGGPGILGPVFEWNDEFNYETDVSWTVPGTLALQRTTLEHVIDSAYDGANDVQSADVDGDGDIDVLGTASSDNDITWWQNANGTGTLWVEHTIDGSFDGASSVYPVDMDGDGDIDVLGSAATADDVAWWENTDGVGGAWQFHLIGGFLDDVFDAKAEDIDGDGDIDVITVADDPDELAWWENVDGSCDVWTEHIITGDLDGAVAVFIADVNDDGYPDILTAADNADDITWWENIDGSGTFWTEHVIDGSFNGAYSVYAADVDNDSYIDVIGAARSADDITWWENVDGSGTSWTEHTVDGYFNNARSVCAADMNGDGYLDIIGAASTADEVSWWMNIDGSGLAWDKTVIDSDFNYAISVCTADLNNDGQPDIVGAASSDDEIAWWDLEAGPYVGSGQLESSILEIPWPVDWSIDWGLINWQCTEPSNTDVAFQVRASDDPGNMGTWSASITTSGTSLAGYLGEYDNYFQYKAMLNSSVSSTTPLLDEVTISWVYVGIEEATEPVPSTAALLPPAPNPSSGSVSVRFSVPDVTDVDIAVFDLSGRLTETVTSAGVTPGYHQVQFSDLPPGIYFCRMIAGDFMEMQRFAVIE
jgi:hypothetical protein